MGARQRSRGRCKDAGDCRGADGADCAESARGTRASSPVRDCSTQDDGWRLHRDLCAGCGRDAGYDRPEAAGTFVHGDVRRGEGFIAAATATATAFVRLRADGCSGHVAGRRLHATIRGEVATRAGSTTACGHTGDTFRGARGASSACGEGRSELYPDVRRSDVDTCTNASRGHTTCAHAADDEHTRDAAERGNAAGRPAARRAFPNASSIGSERRGQLHAGVRKHGRIATAPCAPASSAAVRLGHSATGTRSATAATRHATTAEEVQRRIHAVVRPTHAGHVRAGAAAPPGAPGCCSGRAAGRTHAIVESAGVATSIHAIVE